MNNLVLRIISGILLIGVFTGAILWSEYSMLGLMLVVYTLSLIEYQQIMKIKNPIPGILAIVIGVIFIIFTYLFLTGQTDQHIYVLVVIASLTSFLLYYILSGKSSLKEMTGIFFFSIWVAISISFYIALGWINNPTEYLPENLLIILGLIWINDIAAFVIGSLFGKHLLAPTVSPLKTVEGFAGGILLNLVAGYLLYLFTDNYSAGFWILTAFLVSLGATAGDLMESKIKREAGVKDSGKLIPGHGGVLDRFDSLFFTAPLAYFLYLLFESL